jgi:hypothetical protein
MFAAGLEDAILVYTAGGITIKPNIFTLLGSTRELTGEDL